MQVSGRNSRIMAESRETVTIPVSFVLRLLASSAVARNRSARSNRPAGRPAASADPTGAGGDPDDRDDREPDDRQDPDRPASHLHEGSDSEHDTQ